MKRRRFIQSVPVVSSALLAQAPPKSEIPKIEATSPDSVGKPVPHFFSPPQFAALRRLSDIIVPALGDTPGALDAGAPEFLDFLIGESPLPRRALYRSGLDSLNTRAIAKFGKAFGALDRTQAETFLQPLLKPWAYEAPPDVFAGFLRTAKADILAATVNSREWISVVSKRSRAANGIGTYWVPAE
ncbi:MAG TPA: gluconate 2-dehydrogenase subunit 3 family protein [Bryobacteraceae bacterium]|nr:gluconate 2-dehydrogenase subunit 3 family protein [Bryobacteraceae bacterium]